MSSTTTKSNTGQYPSPLLFVCTANLGRSPFAEVWCRDRGLEARSAGVAAGSGIEVPHPFQLVARSAGIDLTDHRSHPLTATLVQQAGTIIPMTHQHGVQIKALYPEVAHKIHYLSLDGRPMDVPDPACARPENLGVIYRLLATCLEETCG